MLGHPARVGSKHFHKGVHRRAQGGQKPLPAPQALDTCSCSGDNVIAVRQKRGNMANSKNDDFDLQWNLDEVDHYDDTIEFNDPVVVKFDEPVVEEAPVEPAPQASAEKPAFDIWKYGRYGPEGDFMSQAHQGPQVSYINEALGLSGDVYTKETFDAVVTYQRDNRLSVSGRVDKATYDSL